MSKKYHREIAEKFSTLNSTLQDKKEEHLEEISSIINKATKNYTNKDLWNKSYEDIVDLFYDMLVETYLQTTTTLRDIYNNITDKIPDVEDFIYKGDKKTLSDRIKEYWDEGASLLKNTSKSETIKDIALHILTQYERILNNEMINVRQGVKKVKKPIVDDDGIEVIIITNGECCDYGGIYLADDAPALPPYHINCECDFWYDVFYPIDEEDLAELQELGWEEEDG